MHRVWYAICSCTYVVVVVVVVVIAVCPYILDEAVESKRRHIEDDRSEGSEDDDEVRSCEWMDTAKYCMCLTTQYDFEGFLQFGM